MLNIGDKIEILEDFGYDEDGDEVWPEFQEIGKIATIQKVYPYPQETYTIVIDEDNKVYECVEFNHVKLIKKEK